MFRIDAATTEKTFIFEKILFKSGILFQAVFWKIKKNHSREKFIKDQTNQGWIPLLKSTLINVNLGSLMLTDFKKVSHIINP